MKNAVFSLLFFVSAHSFAQCEYVFALTKTVSTEVSNKDTVEQHVQNFCSEYRKSNSVSSSTSAGASYKFLQASFSGGNASQEEVFNKYCSAESSYSSAKFAYKTYLESISPLAYNSYEQCLKQNQDLRYEFDSTTLPTYFAASAHFASSIAANRIAQVYIEPSPGIECHWNGTPSASTQIPTGQSTYFKCERKDPGKLGLIKLVRVDTSNSSVSIPWAAMDNNGIPLTTLNSLREKLNALEITAKNLDQKAKNLEQKVQSFRSATGTVSINENNLQNAGGARGIFNERVNFETPFSTPPTVQIALSALDIGKQENVRVAVEVTKVDVNGFNYDLKVWSSTILHMAIAKWIAVSK
ncbi:H-type lectin domain-containing protein [Herbaspirillum huttiense]|uniref:H-type lectin domain-containing protein n=1 Tax=Herbaspirillum huttiense TaxID=863372 RepID=UPI003B3A7033